MNGVHISVLSQADYHTSAWAGGSTTQLAIFPASAVYAKRNFLWRLSSATVEAEHSLFTALPGVKRHLMPLQGTVELCHVGQPALKLHPFEVDVFDGGAETESIGQCTDFNLMTRETCEGALASFLCSSAGIERTLGGEQNCPVTEAFYAADGKGTAELGGGTHVVPQGGLLVIQLEQGMTVSARFSAEQEVHVVQATMREH